MAETSLDLADVDGIDVPATRDTAVTRNTKEKVKTSGKKTSTVNLVFIIVSILFLVGVIICVIDTDQYPTGGDLDRAITEFFSNITVLDALGDFMDPDFIKGSNFGQVFSYIYWIIALVLLIVSGVQISQEKKKARAENRDPVITPAQKYFKYGILLLFVALVGALGLTRVFKHLWGRPRPGDLGDPLAGGGVIDFVEFFIPGNLVYPEMFGELDSFFSGHTAQAATLICLAYSFIGSRKKWAAPLLAVAVSVYVVLMGISRMAHGSHWFSDVLFGGYVIYALTHLTYFSILYIPDQEKQYRYRLVHDPFNAGYKLVLQAKKNLQEKKIEEVEPAIKKALEYFQASKDAIADQEKFGHDFSALNERIDDLTTRLQSLLEDLHSVNVEDETGYGAYLSKWMYVF